MFLVYGELRYNNNSYDVFTLQRSEMILSTAKALVEDTKQLVAGANGGQEKLAIAAQSASSTINSLANTVKRGATSLGTDDPDTQVCDNNQVVSSPLFKPFV